MEEFSEGNVRIRWGSLDIKTLKEIRGEKITETENGVRTYRDNLVLILQKIL